MVKHFLALLAVLCLLSVTTVQAGELRVEPDRTQMYEGEVLTLTVTGHLEAGSGLGGLLNFNISGLPQPDIEKVEPDFRILSRSQRYSMQTINGEVSSEIIWTYQLAPTRTGTLTIPALTLKGESSQPIQIEVLPGAAANRSGRPRPGFIELEADKAEVYVQEQLVLTVRLFFSGSVLRGELSEPEHPDTIIEPLGKQREYSRYRGGHRYRVVERRYALFPQKPGELQLPPIRFEGQARAADGSLRYIQDQQELFSILVKPVPAGFSGDTWLPASNLILEESGLPQQSVVHTGDSLTRTLVIRAEGLPAETLPSFTQQMPQGIRAYPEQPERSTETGQNGIRGILQQRIALVPLRPGTVTLPEIRIPWWDTDTDTEQVAVIRPRTMSVTGTTAGSDPAKATPAPATPSPEQPPETADDATLPATGQSGQSAPVHHNPWFWTSLALALAWGLTLLWYRRRPDTSRSQIQKAQDPAETALFEQLIRAAAQGSPDTLRLLLRWMRLRYPDQTFHGVDDVTAFLGDTTLASELEKLQRACFANPSGTAGKAGGRELVRALKRARQRQDAGKGQDSGLPPLYPDSLSA